jgi:hypothetical protein
MRTNHYIGLAIAINVFVATILFTLGSLLPYLQLYVYRVNLIENKPHNYFSINSSLLLQKTSALHYICKDTLNKISTDISNPETYKIILNQCEEIFSEKNDSLTYALLGKINAVTWQKSKEVQYLNSAQHYFELAKQASPNNEKAMQVQKESSHFIQSP